MCEFIWCCQRRTTPFRSLFSIETVKWSLFYSLMLHLSHLKCTFDFFFSSSLFEWIKHFIYACMFQWHEVDWLLHVRALFRRKKIRKTERSDNELIKRASTWNALFHFRMQFKCNGTIEHVFQLQNTIRSEKENDTAPSFVCCNSLCLCSVLFHLVYSFL